MQMTVIDFNSALFNVFFFFLFYYGVPNVPVEHIPLPQCHVVWKRHEGGCTVKRDVHFFSPFITEYVEYGIESFIGHLKSKYYYYFLTYLTITCKTTGVLDVFVDVCC